MMRAAREILEGESHRPFLIGVTVLTSMSEPGHQELGSIRDLGSQVDYLAGLARDSGLDGVVCSPNECQTIKKINPSFLTVTPGIRFNSIKDDQKRVYNHIDAMNLGSDYLVIGRSITRSRDPLNILQTINTDLEKFKL